MPYIREEKAKVQRFVSSLPLTMRERIEFDNPKTMDEAIRRQDCVISRTNQKEKILESIGQISGAVKCLWVVREHAAASKKDFRKESILKIQLKIKQIQASCRIQIQ